MYAACRVAVPADCSHRDSPGIWRRSLRCDDRNGGSYGFLRVGQGKGSGDPSSRRYPVLGGFDRPVVDVPSDERLDEAPFGALVSVRADQTYAVDDEQGGVELWPDLVCG